MATKFEEAFKKSLIAEAAQEDVPPADAPVEPVPDDQAFADSLEPETDPSTFDVDPAPDVNISADGVAAAREWIQKIEDFSEFINGLSTTSLNAQINKLDMKSPVFRGVVRTQQKRITGIAEDLASLSEVFKSVILGAEKKISDAKKS